MNEFTPTCFALQVKVDSKTRVDLLKYILKKKQKKDNDEAVDEEAVSSQLVLYVHCMWWLVGCIQRRASIISHVVAGQL